MVRYKVQFRFPSVKGSRWITQQFAKSLPEAKKKVLDEVLVREHIRARKRKGVRCPSLWRLKKVC